MSSSTMDKPFEGDVSDETSITNINISPSDNTSVDDISDAADMWKKVSVCTGDNTRAIEIEGEEFLILKSYSSCLINELIYLIKDFDGNEHEWEKKVKCLNIENLENILNLFQDYVTTPFELKRILMSWKNYRIVHKHENNLRKRRTNLYLNLWRHLFKKLNNTELNNEKKPMLKIKCSYKLLKSLNLNGVVNNNVFVSHMSNYEEKDISIRNLIHWPYININFDTNIFIMQHLNCHHSEFRFLNIQKGLSPLLDIKDTRLYYRPTSSAEELSLLLITDYFKKLTDYISSLPDEKFYYHILLIILDVLSDDLVLVSQKLHTSTKYFRNLVKHPYFRYFNHDIMGRKRTKWIRLEQAIYPAVNFEIIKNCDDINIENEIEIDMEYLVNNINMTCTLCDIAFKPLIDMNSIVEHIKSHGPEPDWTCSKCKKNFSIRTLTSKSWYHDCKP